MWSRLAVWYAMYSFLAVSTSQIRVFFDLQHRHRTSLLQEIDAMSADTALGDSPLAARSRYA